MKKDQIVIIGGGLLGTELDRLITRKGGNSKIVKNVIFDQEKILNADTEMVIIVAQSKDYRKPTLTQDLFYVNTILPIQIIKQAVDAGIKKFAYCSTGSVYSNSSKHHTEEEMLISDNITSYVATKRAAEILITSWKQYFDRLIIFRPFFMYGSHQQDDKLFSKILFSIKNGSSIKLANGKGLIFNPIHVQDAARFILMSMETGKGFDIFNVAGSQDVSLQEVVIKISEFLNKSPNVENTDEVEKVLLGSINKMKSTGFNHAIKLEEGLKEMIFNNQD